MKRSLALLGVVSAGLLVLDGSSAESGLQHGLLAEASPTTRSSAQKEGPTPDLFRNPPIEARPGAFWDWLNGNVDLAQLTHELEEMKAKGMSGAEIWDIGTYSQNPDEAPIQSGPTFMGAESLKAINHAIDEATRLGLIWAWSRQAAGMPGALGSNRKTR